MTLPGKNHIVLAGALALALAFLYVDARKGVELVWRATEADTARVPGEASPAGNAGGARRLVLPTGADAYHWLLQTEQMLTTGELRVRRVAYDNAPHGREVHWSSAVRWWTGSLALGYRQLHPGLTPTQALERVAPWAMPLAFATLLLVLSVVLVRGLGPLPAGLFATAAVAVLPSYALWHAGSLDHTGPAALAAFAVVALLAAAGGGYVRSAAPAAGGAGTHWQWLREPASARRWMIASGIAAGAGLWLSAATLVPVLAATGIAALAGTGLLARTGRHPEWRTAPELWRVWGFAGGAASLGCYLLEYFPAHLGVRLEVNHPLYALGLAGAGDVLSRLCAWLAGGDRPDPRALLVGAGAVALLPAIVLLVPATFLVADPFLWAVHQHFIDEFGNFGRALSVLALPELLMLLLPVVMVPPVALLWSSPLPRRDRWIWRLPLVAVLGTAVVLLHALAFLIADRATAGAAGPATLHAAALGMLAALAFLLFHLPRRWGASLAAPARSVLLLTLLPAAAMLALGFSQQRWIGIAFTLLLATLAASAAVLVPAESGFRWSRGARAMAAVLLVVVLLPFPGFTIVRTWPAGYHPPLTLQRTTRDVAHLLRTRLGDEQGVVLSGPTTTSFLIYFGGLRGVGTLYWENLEGLRIAAELYATGTDDEARSAIDQLGVTHIVLYLEEPFLHEYPAIARRMIGGEALARRPESAFAQRALDPARRPAWLREIPLPPDPSRQTAPVVILEVVRTATPN